MTLPSFHLTRKALFAWAAKAPATGPQDGVVALASDRPTVVLLAHPGSCSAQAALTVLADALSRARVTPRTYVLFMRPQGFGVPADSSDTPLWRQAAALPGVTVMRDDDGRGAQRFGAGTSGQMVIYDANGTLRFSGSVTGSRGHADEKAAAA